MNKLIEPEYVSNSKLFSLLSDAYAHPQKDSNGEISAVLNDMNVYITLNSERNLIKVYAFTVLLHESKLKPYEPLLLQKMHEYTRRFAFVRFSFQIRSDGSYLFVTDFYCRYNFGLNFPQFLDDCKFFINIFRDTAGDLYDFFKGNGVI